MMDYTHGQIARQAEICGEKDGLYMGRCLKRQGNVMKKMDYTWANIKIGKDICVEKLWIYTRQITK